MSVHVGRIQRHRLTQQLLRFGVVEEWDERSVVVSDTMISVVVDRIVERFEPSRVLIFGSQARGTAHRRSDVDLLVVMPEVEDKRRTAIDIRRSLGDLSISKDVVVTTPEEIERRGHVVGSVLHAALREGRVVYDAQMRGIRRSGWVSVESAPW